MVMMWVQAGYRPELRMGEAVSEKEIVFYEICAIRVHVACTIVSSGCPSR